MATFMRGGCPRLRRGKKKNPKQQKVRYTSMVSNHSNKIKEGLTGRGYYGQLLPFVKVL